MDKKYLFEICGLIILLLLLVIPGIIWVGLFSHEIYHYKQHSNYTQAICFSINSNSSAFVIVNQIGEIDQFDYELEELRANKFSRIITSFYSLIVLCTLVWIIIIVIENKRLRK